MNDLHRCRQCCRFFEKAHPVACHKCQGVFCSVPCKIVHDCRELPDLIAPWDEEHALDLRIPYSHDRGIDHYNLPALKRRDGNITCYRCLENRALWNRIYKGPPVCLACLRTLRQEVLLYMCWPADKGIPFTNGYRVIRVKEERNLNTLDAYTMFWALYRLAKFQVEPVKMISAGDETNFTIMFSDLTRLYIGTATILHIQGRILEFIPGIYYVVKEKGI